MKLKIINLQKLKVLPTRFMFKFFYIFHLFSKLISLHFLYPLLDKVIQLTLKIVLILLKIHVWKK